MRLGVFRLLLVVAICLPAARGQEVKTETAKPEKSDQESGQPQVELMTMSQKNAEMNRLVSALAGTWSVNEQYANGDTGSGEEIWRAGPGGVPLMQEYRLKSSTGKEATGFAVIWWDREAKKYQGSWCSDFNDQGCSNFNVKWEGEQIEFTGVYTDGGRRVAWKEIFVLSAPNAFVQMLEMGEEGQELKRISTIRAKKTGEAPASQ